MVNVIIKFGKCMYHDDFGIWSVKKNYFYVRKRNSNKIFHDSFGVKMGGGRGCYCAEQSQEFYFNTKKYITIWPEIIKGSTPPRAHFPKSATLTAPLSIPT